MVDITNKIINKYYNDNNYKFELNINKIKEKEIINKIQYEISLWSGIEIKTCINTKNSTSSILNKFKFINV